MCQTLIGSNIHISVLSNAHTGPAFQESVTNSSYIAGYGGLQAVERDSQYSFRNFELTFQVVFLPGRNVELHFVHLGKPSQAFAHLLI